MTAIITSIFKGRLSKQAIISVVFILIIASITLWILEGRKNLPSETLTSSSTELPPPSISKLVHIEGWIPSWINGESIVHKSKDQGFTDLLFFNGTVKPSGNVKIESPNRLHRAVALADALDMSTWFTVTNHGHSFGDTLTPEEIRAHADQIVEAWKTSGCQHLDLDYENISHDELKTLASILPQLASKIEAIRPNAKLSLTLQPADNEIRNWMLSTYKTILASDAVSKVRFMCYDYHWRTSLPGALYPKWAYERLLKTYTEHQQKIGICLPLYGYDWPRPDNTSLPRGKVILYSELETVMENPGSAWAWTKSDGELMGKYQKPDGTLHYVAAPNPTMIAQRVGMALQAGIPSVAFWHLGCAQLSEVVHPCKHWQSYKIEEDKTVPSWESMLTPFKERVCQKIIAQEDDTFRSIAERYECSRSKLMRFNDTISKKEVGKSRIYVPCKSATK